MCHLCDALVNDLPQLVMADNRQLGGGHVDHCHQDAIAVLGNRIGPHGNFVSGVADAVPATRKVTRDEQVNGLVGVVVGEHQNITRCGAALHQPRDPRVDEAAPAEKLVDAPCGIEKPRGRRRLTGWPIALAASPVRADPEPVVDVHGDRPIPHRRHRFQRCRYPFRDLGVCLARGQIGSVPDG